VTRQAATSISGPRGRCGRFRTTACVDRPDIAVRIEAQQADTTTTDRCEGLSTMLCRNTLQTWSTITHVQSAAFKSRRSTGLPPAVVPRDRSPVTRQFQVLTGSPAAETNSPSITLSSGPTRAMAALPHHVRAQPARGILAWAGHEQHSSRHSLDNCRKRQRNSHICCTVAQPLSSERSRTCPGGGR
jgi:hypothetical protein